MRKARFVLLLATLAGLLQAGCGDSSSDDATGSEGRSDAGTTVADVSAEDIEVGGLLAQIRGHHRAAVERYEARDRAAALKHAQHPAREVLSAVQPELEKHAPGASAALTRSLQRVAAAVNAGQPATKVEETVDAAAKATLTAERQVVGETADSEAYRGSVIASIVSTAAHEYEEALAGDRVARLDEYQDGFGFVREAAAMYRSIAPLVEESVGQGGGGDRGGAQQPRKGDSFGRPPGAAGPARGRRAQRNPDRRRARGDGRREARGRVRSEGGAREDRGAAR